MPVDSWDPSDAILAALQPMLFYDFFRFLGTSKQHPLIALFLILLFKKVPLKMIKSASGSTI